MRRRLRLLAADEVEPCNAEGGDDGNGVGDGEARSRGQGVAASGESAAGARVLVRIRFADIIEALTMEEATHGAMEG